MPLNALIVTPWFPNQPADQGGNFILHSAEALIGSGVSVSVLVCRAWVPRIFGLFRADWNRPPINIGAFDPALRIGLVNYLSVPRSLLNELYGPLLRLVARGAIRTIVQDRGIRIIHAHTEAIGHAIAPIAKELGIPLVITVHGINTEARLLNTAWKRRRLREALRNAARVVLVGESLRTHFKSLAGGDANFRVVHNGFRPFSSRRSKKRPDWGVPLRLISVSNLHEGKGIDLNIEALARLRDVGIDDWAYAIVGAGAERAGLERLANRLGLGDKITFHGRVSHDRVSMLLEDADVFVLPSYREAFGIAYLEAMAAGLLAIGVLGQGPEAFIRHGETGLLVDPRSVESLFLALRSVFEQGPQMRRIAAAGRTHVEGEFTWERHAARVVTVYEEALSER